jgi:hypothetical protein
MARWRSTLGKGLGLNGVLEISWVLSTLLEDQKEIDRLRIEIHTWQRIRLDSIQSNFLISYAVLFPSLLHLFILKQSTCNNGLKRFMTVDGPEKSSSWIALPLRSSRE